MLELVVVVVGGGGCFRPLVERWEPKDSCSPTRFKLTVAYYELTL